MEGMVRVQPLACELEILATGVAHLHESRGGVAESLLGRLERREVVVGHLRRRDLGGQALELGAHHERLANLVPRQHAHPDAAVRLEGDEAERREPPQGLAHGCPRHVELLGQVLLAKHAPRRDLSGDDRLLERERDVVGLRAVHLRLDLEEPLVGGHGEELRELLGEREPLEQGTGLLVHRLGRRLRGHLRDHVLDVLA